MSIKTALKEAAKWLAMKFGEDILVFIGDKLKSRYKKYFENKNILILGNKQTGKTSLAYLMTEGKPYKTDDNGDIKTPSPTAMTSVIDQRTKLDEDSWANVKKDVPGDKGLRDTWSDAIEEISPHGIIYMIDGSKSDDEISDSLSDMKEVLSSSYKHGVGNLEVVHIFVNFSDHWSEGKIKDRENLRKIEDIADKMIVQDRALKNLSIETHRLQLSPNKSSWDEADKAISKFGADLKSM
ncbi:ADP-ribosylation factor-like protein [Salinibacter ruber]|jgi:hypothetical protein|uniref:ADP-ribosylation factor-like protein n=1 Tax=Salinibacter ruber TaxID=146919 RepID=UPI00216996AD|nr:ADP-ribosylation factor-like protein [Salinibacter ruber]MCS4097454.1 hypothetical protein [Salinibacter ruber]MCS4154156.1 hypothetical protein [Salinibacter ruber]